MTTRRFLDPAVCARLSRQQIGTRLPMVGNVTGHHKSPHNGSSVEFSQYRKYVPGDDIRRLDWRVYAKTDRFYIKEFEADTNLRCYCVLDVSASMGFTGAGESKFDYARKLIATLAYLFVQQGDGAGLVCLGEKKLHDIPPKRTPAHLQNVFHTLETVQPLGGTALVRTLHDMAEQVRQRALVIIFSDFFAEVEPLLDCLQHLRFQKHDLVLFQLLDRQELDFPFDRPIRFVDLESPASVLAEPAVIKQQYTKALNAHQAALKAGCNRFNAELHTVATDLDYEKVLGNFLLGRAVL
jgi:uncharacterized protein (DUF58 family)